MPNRKTHELIGTISGAGVSLIRSGEQRPSHRLAELLGGAVGGHVGARLPDVFEPAIHSHHRNVWHSCATAGTLAHVSRKICAELEQGCHSKADAIAATRSQSSMAWWERFFSWLSEMLWRVAAGFASGVPVGFLSHLAADATTPRCIPLLTRGF